MMETSACVGEATTVEAEAELLPAVGSLVADVTAGLFEIVVPAAVATFTFTTNGKLLTLPDARVVAVQEILPVPPTAGVTQDQPTGTPSETNVVFAGTVSVSESVAAAAGPLFVTV